MNRKRLIIVMALTVLLSFAFSQTTSAAFLFKQYKQFKVKNPVSLLMYHMFSENPEEWSNYCTSPETLEKDIVYLINNGYEFLTANELATTYIPNPYKKYVLITLDDGYTSDYLYVLPLLEKYQVKATFFVTGAYIGQPGYMTEEMLQALSQSPYAEIGNHSFENHSLPYEELKTRVELNPKPLMLDFRKNKILLERITGKTVTSLSYPNGLYSRELNALLLLEGNKIVFSTDLQKFMYGSPDIAVGRINRPHGAEISDLMEIEFHD